MGLASTEWGLLGSTMVLGLRHGIGAETPTQIGLIVLAAGFTDPAFAALVGAVFVAGLLVTHVAMCMPNTRELSPALQGRARG